MITRKELLDIIEKWPSHFSIRIKKIDLDFYNEIDKEEGRNFSEKLYLHIHGEDKKICKVGGCDNKTSFQTFKKGYLEFCSIKCRDINRHEKTHEMRKCIVCEKEYNVSKKSTTKKYLCGVECARIWNRSDECNEKRLQTMQETNQKKYGVDYTWQTNDVKEQIKNTKLERYGDENYNNVEKNKKTKLERYGDENAFGFHSEQLDQIILEKHGDKNYNNRETFAETMNTKYGGIGLQRENVKSAAQQGMVEKYGVKHALQSKEIRNKSVETMIEKYGKETFWGSETQRDLIKHKFLDKVIIVLQSRNISLLDEYTVSKITENGKITHIQYNFKCGICDYKFTASLANGNIPLCRKCNPVYSKSSQGEQELAEYIKSIYSGKVIENDRTVGAEIDIHIPEKKVGIEYDGLYWHSDLNGKDKKYHLNKTLLCRDQGIRLIHIFEDEWINKQGIVKDKLRNILGLSVDRIYARNCIVKEITAETKNNFLELYHIQGSDKSKYKLGLFHQNQLIGVMTFGNRRVSLGKKESEIGEYELIRFATSINVIGGASKLLKYFIRTYNPTKIVSYADLRWTSFDSNLYEKIGFQFSGQSDPNYWYVNNGQRFHRFNFRKSVLNEKLEKFNSDLTEWINMQINGYDRIWDCGNLRYTWF